MEPDQVEARFSDRRTFTGTPRSESQILRSGRDDRPVSWDIFIQDLPGGITSTDEIPPDFIAGSIGTRSSLIANVKEVVPDADFSDPECGHIDGPDCWITARMIGSEDAIECIALEVRGGESGAGIVADILDRLQLRAIDGGAPGHLFSREHALASFTEWAGFRDRVIPRPTKPAKGRLVPGPGRWLWKSRRRHR